MTDRIERLIQRSIEESKAILGTQSNSPDQLFGFPLVENADLDFEGDPPQFGNWSTSIRWHDIEQTPDRS